MRYFIDGYNYLFRFGFGEKDFSQSRQQLIQELSHKVQSLEIEMTLVFDAQYQEDEVARSHYQHLAVLYSGFGETADDLILNEVKAQTNPRQVVVVTSDKKLAWFARRCSARTESIEEFNDWLNRRFRNRLKQAKKKTVPIKPESVEPRKKIKKPTVSSSVEQCFDYYLERFESSDTEGAAQHMPKPKIEKAFHKEPKEKEEKSVSEADRWLKIFEEKFEQIQEE